MSKSPLDALTLPLGRRIHSFLQELGAVTLLLRDVVMNIVRQGIDFSAAVTQLERLGVRSLGLAAATAIFVGLVMAIQFAVTLEKFGAIDSVGRIVSLSQTRELAPALTALVVGCRIASGLAAELGSMAVTEQIDAIHALGANPVRKLVVPRVLATTLAMPLMTLFALVLSIVSAMIVSHFSFGVSASYFLASALDTVTLSDFGAGMAKTPFFGAIIGLVGCFYGVNTTGGTEGVGRATTTAVVVVSISVLIADTLLTQLLIAL